jgi:hypothetical protein
MDLYFVMIIGSGILGALVLIGGIIDMWWL